MIKSNDLITDFYQKHKEFGYLQSININRKINEEGCSDYSLDITLSDYPFFEGSQKLFLIFLGVRNIKIGDLEGLLKLVISINNISNNQMDGLNYRVSEEEYGLISFYCESFQFKII